LLIRDVAALATLSSKSYDGADQGFLTERYQNFLSAPLFQREQITGTIACN
jgi:hypothetical protein